ncbi:hypothetical protein ACTFIY_009873 [Dictyostelium cf. discoideum]
MKSDTSSDSEGSSHLLLYHSISKLNQNYESVEIINDFIPLYAVYRFLQSPNLHTLKFDLQFHFLSSIYDNQTNVIDNIEFGSFQDGDVFDNGINEDDHTYCTFSDQEDLLIEIRPYSMSLWKQCLKLLSTNSTITNLSISHNCENFNQCGWNENSRLNENFFNDFMNSLANNKTIKTLKFDFNNRDFNFPLNNLNLINKSIASMLDENSTIESIYIFIPFLKLNQISNLRKNTKCKIITNKDEQS